MSLWFCCRGSCSCPTHRERHKRPLSGSVSVCERGECVSVYGLVGICHSFLIRLFWRHKQFRQLFISLRPLLPPRNADMISGPYQLVPPPSLTLFYRPSSSLFSESWQGPRPLCRRYKAGHSAKAHERAKRLLLIPCYRTSPLPLDPQPLAEATQCRHGPLPWRP